MIKLQLADFNIEEETLALRGPFRNTGAAVVFLGTARDFSKGKDIKGLEFEYYPGMAEKSLERLRDRTLKEFDVLDVGIIHRFGKIEIAENIVLIIVVSQHRKEAFKACEFCIDELKRSVPIWKKEFTVDGDVWVEDHP
ncbi:MAG: molybdenum cofactor biosynthesis protein MoaE [Nitrospinae bacterium]|nr:molybdenum cofactor biosynthesis protein MoaE [Nitrospinota bacterium]